MSALFGMSGLIGAIILLVLKKKGKIKETDRKKALIALSVCVIFFIVGLAIPSNTKTEKGSTNNDNSAAQEEIGNVKSLSFYNTDGVTIRVGETLKDDSRYYLKYTANRKRTVSPDDVEFVSDNPEIATISLINYSSSKMFFEITGVSAGETYVYASSKDGSVTAEGIKITVPKPIEVERIEITYEKTEMAVGETSSPTIAILPENAEDKTISWVSSDESVATINEKGEIVALGGGSTTITASSKNGISSSVEVFVDGSKHLMRVRVSHPRDDNNNIGDEWSYIIEINGERPASTMVLSPKDKLNCWAKFTEEDSKPDVGEASKTYVVKEEDLLNGFSITMDLYVKENGGSNRGKAAHFIVTYTFSPNIE